ncbi:MAG: type II secretion system protein [Phycisphaerales bacterium]|nr:MAG: type II secretion system protein [Phycisphaerales bacterium]
MRYGRQTELQGESPPARAFTLVEMLVVFVVIIILLSSILVGGSALTSKAKATATESVLVVVRDALEEFKRQQTDKPTIVSAKQSTGSGSIRYKDRYGEYPPDELEVFTAAGLPLSKAPPANRSLAVGKVSVIPSPLVSVRYTPMRFYTVGNETPEQEHRDLAAMIVAIEMHCPSARMMLNKLPESNWSEGAVGASGKPVQFVDFDGDQKWTPGEDEQIRYITDAWGVPITYFAQRDYNPKPGSPSTASLNHSGWNQTSTEIIRLNRGQPVIMSYGADGKEQLRKDVLDADPSASLLGDWAGEEVDQRINNPYNEDNIYADPELSEKLAAGAP